MQGFGYIAPNQILIHVLKTEHMCTKWNSLVLKTEHFSLNYYQAQENNHNTSMGLFQMTRVEKTWKLGKLVSGTNVCFEEESVQTRL
jgi:hypothetical protein